MTEFDKLTTESHLHRSRQLDLMSAAEIVDLFADEDLRVADAVATQREHIAGAIELIADRLGKGGRLFYLGAGTSGRLGVLDASECPPTFGAPPEQVIGIIAGGDQALRTSIEGAEDRTDTAEVDLNAHDFNSNDVLTGISTSGRTPYVVGGLRFAQKLGAATIGFTCNSENRLSDICDVLICPVVGPEIISGSTRMKSGTATKMVLNMLTTGAMVLLGKTYGNLMVDLRTSNAKLTDRAIRMVGELAGVDRAAAIELLERSDGELKVAVIAKLANVEPDSARSHLQEAGGQLRRALETALETPR